MKRMAQVFLLLLRRLTTMPDRTTTQIKRSLFAPALILILVAGPLKGFTSQANVGVPNGGVSFHATNSQKIDRQTPGTQKAGPQPQPPVVQVDSGVKPKMASLPGIQGGPDRVLGSVTDAKGNQADFVLNELVVSTDDTAKLSALASRWRGRIFRTIDFANVKLKGSALTGIPKLHLVQIDATAADVSKLSADLRTVDPNSRGRHRISSEAGLKLLAVAANEAAQQGTKVSLNWIMYGSGISDGTTAEAPRGATTGADYRENAFQWPYMNRGSEQDIGVGAAWQALAARSKLGNHVKILVADGGFLINADLPDSRSHYGPGDWGTRNPFSCGGGTCPWHGTQVVAAAMGRPDNRFGIAGPAGPVAELIALQNPADLFEFFHYLFSIVGALAEGPDIINISGGARVPATLALFVDPIVGAICTTLRSAGTLVFASAGNEGQDVDEEDDILGLIFWEEAAWLPCEADSVICVGGMNWDTTRKHRDSNWGGKAEADSVDIYGPYVVWGYTNPRGGDYSAQKIFGTSYSSPFVAGVAALVWAADPTLSANRVWEIVRDTAHRGGLFPDDRRRLRVNAFAAVKRALGVGNFTPEVNVHLAGGSTTTVDLNRAVNVRASARDIEDGDPCCTVTWNYAHSSSSDSGRNAVFVFTTTGIKNIIATATDRGGATQTDSLSVNVVNTPPQPTIEQPVPDTNVYLRQELRLLGSATDRNEGPGPGPGNLACDRLVWTSSNPRDSAFPGRGCDATVTFASTGRRTLTLTATDSLRASGTASISVNVLPPPANLSPTITVGTRPPVNYTDGYRWDQPIIISASARDPEGDVPITYRWIAVSYYPNSSRIFFTSVIASGATAELNWTPSSTPALFMRDCSEGSSYYGQVVRLTLQATDRLGNAATRAVRDIKVYRCILM